MTITIIGWIVIPLSVAAVLLKPTWLYVATICFLPFSATSVVNFGSGNAASGMQVWFWLAFLLVARWSLVAVLKLGFRLDIELRRSVRLLMIFILISGLSMIMPLWINGRLQIMSPSLLDFTTTPLYFSSKNITGFLYLLVGSAFAIIVAVRNVEPKSFILSVRSYVLSCGFVAIWGLLQMALNIAHYPYPAFIFNNSASPYAAGYAETLGASEMARLTSVAVEPSMLVQTILIAMVFMLPSICGSGKLIGKYSDWLLTLLFIFICLAATSSTGYIGLFLLLVLVGWMLFKTGKWYRAFVTGAALIGSLLVAAYFVSSTFRDVANNAIVNKGSSFSALERAKTVYYALQYWVDYPVLGIGWASATSHDVFAKLLSNTGIVGLIAFCAFVGVLVVQLYRHMGRGSRAQSCFEFAPVVLFVAVVEMMVLASITEFPDVFGHFWFILGIAIASTGRRIASSPLFSQLSA